MTEDGPAPGIDAADDGVDLGSGVRVRFTSWGPHAPAGFIEFHRTPEGRECGGAVLFDLPGVREAFPDRPVWTVQEFDPLTISPSLLCRTCGHHGFIQGGRWVPA